MEERKQYSLPTLARDEANISSDESLGEEDVGFQQTAPRISFPSFNPIQLKSSIIDESSLNNEDVNYFTFHSDLQTLQKRVSELERENLRLKMENREIREVLEKLTCKGFQIESALKKIRDSTLKASEELKASLEKSVHVQRSSITPLPISHLSIQSRKGSQSVYTEEYEINSRFVETISKHLEDIDVLPENLDSPIYSSISKSPLSFINYIKNELQSIIFQEYGSDSFF